MVTFDILLQFVLEKNVFRILGRAIGLKDGKRSLPPKNDVLEAEYSSSRKLDQSSICRLAKKLDMSERKIERWLRQR